MCSALHISQSIPKPSLQHYMLEESTLFLEYLSVLLKRDTSPLCHSSLPTREEDATWVQGCPPCLFQYFQWSSFPTLVPHISKSTASFQVMLRWTLYHSSWFHRMLKDILLSIILTRRLLSILQSLGGISLWFGVLDISGSSCEYSNIRPVATVPLIITEANCTTCHRSRESQPRSWGPLGHVPQPGKSFINFLQSSDLFSCCLKYCTCSSRNNSD